MDWEKEKALTLGRAHELLDEACRQDAKSSLYHLQTALNHMTRELRYNVAPFRVPVFVPADLQPRDFVEPVDGGELVWK